MGSPGPLNSTAPCGTGELGIGGAQLQRGQTRADQGSSFEMVPKMVFGAEALDLVKLDVGALGPGGRRTGDPPLGAGQSG